MIKNVLIFLIVLIFAYFYIFYMCFYVLYGYSCYRSLLSPLCAVLEIELSRIGWSKRRSPNKNERDFWAKRWVIIIQKTRNMENQWKMMLFLVLSLHLEKSSTTRETTGLWEYLQVFLLVLIAEMGSPDNSGHCHSLAETLDCVCGGGEHVHICLLLFIPEDGCDVPAAWSHCCLNFSIMVACALDGDLKYTFLCHKLCFSEYFTTERKEIMKKWLLHSRNHNFSSNELEVTGQ